jgi:predicted MFS family arabinose efflux permease
LADPRRVLWALVVALGVGAFEAAGQHPSAVSLVVVAAGLAAVFWGLHGLLPAGTFRVRPGVPTPVALRGLLAGAFFGCEAVVPLMLQTQHGLGPTAAGLPLSCAGVSWAVGSWWQGRAHAGDIAAHRVRLLRAGFACVAAAIALVAVTSLPGASPWLAYPAWLLSGLGAGLAMPTSSVLLLNHTTDAARGSDSAALQLADTTMSALTTGVAGILVAAAAREAIGYTGAFVSLDLAMVAIAVTGIVASGRAGTVPAWSRSASSSVPR